MGIPKCFSHLGCFEVTFILRDFKTVTGKIVGALDEDRKKYWGPDKKSCDGDKHDCKCTDVDVKVDVDCGKKDGDYDGKHDCKHDCKHICKCPDVDVKVDVDEKCDFILVELTRDASSVFLQEVELEDSTLEIEWLNVEFEAGTCVAVNVCDIIYAGVNADIDEEEVEIPLDSAVATTS